MKKKFFFKPKIRKDDIVIVLSGKDKGKQGIVLKIVKLKLGYKLLVEGINVKKKHVKGDPQKQKTGGIIKKESPIDISNIAIFNKETLKGDRIEYKILENRKVRVFKSNKKEITYKS